MSYPDFAIIIPYYQREPGLLRRAVTSALEAAGGRAAQVIVVDDGSPHRAEKDLVGLKTPSTAWVKIIHQENAGPAAARNTGLNNVAEGARWVTFLDSDDYWIGPFLEDAENALSRGFDFFFGNSRRFSQRRARFEWGKNPEENINPSDHPQVDPVQELYEFRGDFFGLLVRRTNIISANTMAYRFDRYSAARFPTELFQGEDRLFKLKMARDLKHIAFSPKIYAEEGEGVNIFDKSNWGSPKSLALAYNYVKLSKMILQQLDLTAEQRSYLAQKLTESRESFLSVLLHLVRIRAPIDWRVVGRMIRDDPRAIPLAPLNLARVMRRRREAAAR